MNSTITCAARLHEASLPDDLLPRLGFCNLKLFYDYCFYSNKEELVTHYDGDLMIGCCLLSYESNTLFTRFLRRSFFQIACNYFFELFMNQRSWGLLRVLSKWRIQEYPSNSPEIAYIFVHEEARGKGIGDLLIKMSCNLCVEGSQNYLYVKTLSDSGNKALGFYKKLGFTTVQEFSYLGRTMALLKLKIQSSVNTF